MQSLGGVPLVLLVVLVVLALDSRRLHALARSTGRARRERGGIPAGAHPDRVGLPLQQIQMRIHVDWEDGGLGWEGPEILPADDFDDCLAGESDGAAGAVDSSPPARTGQTMPVLWRPFPALPAGSQSSTAGVVPSPV